MSDFDDESGVGDRFDEPRADGEPADLLTPLAQGEAGGAASRFGVLVAGGTVAVVLALVGFMMWGGGDESSEAVLIGGAGAAVDVADLFGGTWELVEGRGPLGQIVIIEGFEPTVMLGNGQLSGNNSCNRFGADLDVAVESETAASITAVGDVFQKLAGCDAAIGEAEERFMAAISDLTRIGLVDGRLELSGPDTLLVFRWMAPAPEPRPALTSTASDIVDEPTVDEPTYASPEELSGTNWVLDNMTVPGQRELILPVDGFPVTLNFVGEEVRGVAGCNGYGGSWSIEGFAFTVNGLGQSDTMCGGTAGVMEVEATYLSILAHASSVHVLDGDALVAFAASVEPPDGDGEHQSPSSLVFTRAEPFARSESTPNAGSLTVPLSEWVAEYNELCVPPLSAASASEEYSWDDFERDYQRMVDTMRALPPPDQFAGSAEALLDAVDEWLEERGLAEANHRRLYDAATTLGIAIECHVGPI